MTKMGKNGITPVSGYRVLDLGEEFLFRCLMGLFRWYERGGSSFVVPSFSNINQELNWPYQDSMSNLSD